MISLKKFLRWKTQIYNMKCTLALFNFFNNFVIKLRVEFLLIRFSPIYLYKMWTFWIINAFANNLPLYYISGRFSSKIQIHFSWTLKVWDFLTFPSYHGTFRFTNQESEISDASRHAVRERLRLKCVKRKQVNAAAGGRLYVYTYMYMLRMQSGCIGVAQFNEVLRSARY